MVNRRQTSGWRLARRKRIPPGIQPKIDQIWRIFPELVTAYRHFKANPVHWHDTPAKRRLEALSGRLRQLLALLDEEAPTKVEALKQELRARFLQERIDVET